MSLVNASGMPVDIPPSILSAMKMCKNPSHSGIAFNDCSMKVDNLFAALAGSKEPPELQKISSTTKIEKDRVTQQLVIKMGDGGNKIGTLLAEVC